MADNDGKIYITISDRRFGTNKAEADEQNNQDKQEKDKKDPLGDYAKHQFFNLIEKTAKQAVRYTLGNIGNFTGDYALQTHVNDSLQIISSLEGVAYGAITGAKIGGGWGALIGAAIAVAGQGVSTGLQLYSGYVENARQNRTISQLRSRAGLNPSNNGSRGTEY